jgi:hypothetical protein
MHIVARHADEVPEACAAVLFPTERLREIACETAAALARDARVSALSLTGSIARGVADAVSDLDMVVFTAPEHVGALAAAAAARARPGGDRLSLQSDRCCDSVGRAAVPASWKTLSALVGRQAAASPRNGEKGSHAANPGHTSNSADRGAAGLPHGWSRSGRDANRVGCRYGE